MVKITKSMTDKLPFFLNRGFNSSEVRVENNHLILELTKDKELTQYEFSRNYDFHKKVNEMLGGK